MSNENKAGQGEAVAVVVSAYGDPEAFGEREVKVLADLRKIPYGTKLYTAPPASADAVSVPVEQRELEWLEHWLLFASEPVGQECCNRPGYECCGCPYPCYRTADDIVTEMHARHAELRALLAQSESKGMNHE